MYADFEALLKPIDPKQKSPKESSAEGAVPTRHYTISVNQHIILDTAFRASSLMGRQRIH